MTRTLPAYESAPPWVTSKGDVVARVNELAGFAPDDDQLEAIRNIFGRREDGKLSAFEGCIIAPRQNLKTAVFEQCALGWLYVEPQRRITWSAHRYDTSLESFNNLRERIERVPALAKRTSFSSTRGYENIRTSNALLRFKARSTTSGRGLSGERIILDEAFALVAQNMGSLIPTLSARQDPQILYGSSAGMVGSYVLREVRNRGRKGSDSRLFYVEYCDDLPGECQEPECDHARHRRGCRLDDERRWARANPAIDRRINREVIRGERRAMPPEEFARERHGWWDEDPSEGGVFDMENWTALLSRSSGELDPVAFAVDVPPDRSSAIIVVAGLTEDELIHVEVIDLRTRTQWVIDRLCGNPDAEDEDEREGLFEKWDPVAVVIAPEGPAGSLIDDIEAAGVPVVKPQLAQVAEAAAQFYDGVEDRKDIRHPGQPDLTRALEGAAQKDVGDRFVWSRRKSDVNISPLIAASNAVWGLLCHLDAGGLEPEDVFVGKY